MITNNPTADPLASWDTLSSTLRQRLAVYSAYDLDIHDVYPRDVPTDHKYATEHFPLALADPADDHVTVDDDLGDVDAAGEALAQLLESESRNVELYPVEIETLGWIVKRLHDDLRQTTPTELRTVLWRGRELVRMWTEPETGERIPVDELDCGEHASGPRWETVGEPPSGYAWQTCTVGGGVFAYIPQPQSADGDNDPVVCTSQVCGDFMRTRS
ncbi:hypothetical protein [Mycolicibacterium fortuitum]|uniref:hypothetical protein n=1 Tax=Mycolicibacterium fortuitum TaxID=1766 RepID=UPI001CDC6E1F|nr:hypothetical protein [Mycolicibacterium fortuitum]UBV14969.1 hypothetical protein H8Z57_30525 [Mycolicibacterium fortuitum]